MASNIKRCKSSILKTQRRNPCIYRLNDWGMMCMQLSDLKVSLLTVTSSGRKFDGTGITCPYIVWAEDGQADAVWANSRMQAQAITGTIDYFTALDNDPNCVKIQDALNDAGIAFRLESVQYARPKNNPS